MAISDDLNSIRTHLEDDYTALEQLGVSVEDRNIENIKDIANQIYAKFPKTDYAEGSNITLSNTLKGKLDFEDGIVGYGDTSQDGTPTPDTPIEIEVVRGKNRSTINSISTTGGGYVNYSVSQLANVTKGETYTLSIKNNTSYTSNLNVRISVGGTYSTETQGNLVANGIKSYTFTASQSGVLNLSSKLGNEDIENALTEIQLEKGSTATSYLPYNTLEARIRSANLVKSKYVNPTVSSYLVVLQADFDIKPSTTYTISFNGREGNKVYFNEYLFDGPATQTYLTIGSGRTIRTITTKDTISDTQKNSDGWYIFKNQAGNTEANIFDDLQIETGSTATTYEPYQTPQKYQLSLGEYEFAKIGNYVDTIEYDVDEDKVYKCGNIIKKAITGNNVYAYQESASYGAYCQLFNLGNAVINIDNEVVILSNIAKGISGNDRITLTETWRVYNYQRNVFIRLPNTSTLTNLTDVKNYLNGISNIYLYYVLETPTRIEITGTLKDQIKALYYSQSFTGTTIIEIDGDLPLVMKVRALKAS